MRTAIALMYVGAGLTVLSAIIFFATIDRYVDALADANDLRSQASIDATVNEANLREIVRTVLGVGLWLWMAVKNGQGRRWARVVATVFGVLNLAGFVLVFAFLSQLASGYDLLGYLIPQLVTGSASVVLGIVILVQLYRPPSSHYYDESTRYEAWMTLRG